MFRDKYRCDKNAKAWDFPGGPVAKTPCSCCRGFAFNPGEGA